MSNDMSIIQKDGGLSVDWAPKDVTWQSVLQAARAANSKQGGWNSQSYWVERGLNRLVSFGQAQAFLQEWTKQSIDALASPAPRIEKFQFDLRRKAEKAGRRGSVEVDERSNCFGIRSEPADPEHRLNWWLYMAHRSRGNKLTYELPLCAESKDLLRADLVHFVPEQGMVEIIELKSGKTGERDNPLMALAEVICYGLQLRRCWQGPTFRAELHRCYDVPDFDVKHLHLVLAAPDFGKDSSGHGKDLDEDGKQVADLRSIVRGVESAVQVEDPDLQISLSLADVQESDWTFRKSTYDRSGITPTGSIIAA